MRESSKLWRSWPRAAFLVLLSLGSWASWLAAPALGDPSPNTHRGFGAATSVATGGPDHVNVFNGNLMVTVPLGNAYPIAPGVSFALSLVYNSQVWDFYEYSTGLQVLPVARPSASSNAGLGWSLSLGRLRQPADPLNTTGAWAYYAPDGGEHVFYDSLHPEELPAPNVFYTRDGSYLRLTDHPTYTRVEFPDNTYRDFDANGLLTAVRNRYGQGYDVVNASDHHRITDSHGRQYWIWFTSPGYELSRRVESVDLPAPGGTRAVYTLGYAETVIARGCPHSTFADPSLGSHLLLPFLTAVHLPDGSTYSMPLASYQTGTPACGGGQTLNDSGVLRGMRLPTWGSVTWDYGIYAFTAPSPPPGPNNPRWEWLSATTGVVARRLENESGGTIGVWTYTPQLCWGAGPSDCSGSPGTPRREARRTIRTPLNDKVEHFFSVSLSDGGSEGWLLGEYGVPASRFEQNGGQFRSQKIYDCAVGDPNACTLVRTVFANYERDSPEFIGADELTMIANRNTRRSASRTVYHDDANSWVLAMWSNFDGLGHYRSQQNSSSFAGTATRTHYEHLNPARGTYPGSFSMLPENQAWILATRGFAWTAESSNTQFESYCWNAQGDVTRKRRHQPSGSGQTAQDVIESYQRDAGGRITVHNWYGGDLQAIGVGNTCGMALPSTPVYRMDHSYSAGSPSLSRFVQPATPSTVVLRTLDRTIDFSTGLPTVVRDSAGLGTTLVYDAMGRVTQEQPAQGGRVRHVYNRAMGASQLASYEMTRQNAAGTVDLAKGRVFYDSLGRTRTEEEWRGGTTWQARRTEYNALGWTTFVSHLGTIGLGTTFSNHDPFGRPGTVQPADGSAHNVTFTYWGDRQLRRTVRVATAADGPGSETTRDTTERYDGHGRLYEVVEPNSVLTRYGYDTANRLASVCHKPSGSTCVQARSFVYDNRGFLLSEQHPEKGTSGNGTVIYDQHDAAGLATRQREGLGDGGPGDLLFTHDAAQRVLTIREFGGAGRFVKDFAYATANNGSDYRRGKLFRANRYNFAGAPFNTTVQVRENYYYTGLQGRLGRKDTQMFVGVNTAEGFTQSYAYNDLGDLSSIGYPDCNVGSCAALDTPRSVSFDYTAGRLSSVPGLVPSISYHPNGMVHQVTHSNGLVMTQANNTHNFARPQSITAVRSDSTLFASGAYAYDGSGNVKSVGTLNYVYDGQSRLLSEGTGVGAGRVVSQSAVYDDAGNLTSLTTGGQVVNFPVAAGTNRLTGRPYDVAGNLLSYAAGSTYQWDSFSQMSRMTNGAEDWVFVYGPGDERFWSYRVGGGGSIWSLRGEDGKTLREYTSHVGWGAHQDYVYRDGVLAVGLFGTGSQRHYTLDHLGTVRLVTDGFGSQLGRHDYNPFGGEKTALQEAERMKWAGHERDLYAAGAADDLDYMHARHYSPVTGRFLSVDPKGRYRAQKSPQAWNRYAYTRGNPLKYVDPNGEDVLLVVRNDAGGGVTNFGHTALRVFGAGYDFTYDFGRYGRTWGAFKSKGEGILRVWPDFRKFIADQRRRGDLKGVLYKTTAEQDRAVMNFFQRKMAEGEKLQSASSDFSAYRLAQDYDLRSNNCTTICLDALESAQEDTGLKFDGLDKMDGAYNPLEIYDEMESIFGESYLMSNTFFNNLPRN